MIIIMMTAGPPRDRAGPLTRTKDPALGQQAEQATRRAVDFPNPKCSDEPEGQTKGCAI